VSLLWLLIGLLVGALLTWLLFALPLQRKLRALQAGAPQHQADATAPAAEDAQAPEKAPAADEAEPTPAEAVPIAVAAPVATSGATVTASTNGATKNGAARNSTAKNGAAKNGTASNGQAKPRAKATRAPKKVDTPASKNGTAPTKAPAENTTTKTETETEAPATAVATIEPGPYPRSARPAADGSAPSPEYTIKGNAGSKLYHTPTSPYFGRTKAQAWFATAEDAEAAGFTAWRRK
jgi:hypothetical protein